MKRPHAVKSVVTYKNWVSAKAIRLSLEHIEPTEVPFVSGQFISLHVGDDNYRAYSICSDPANTRKMDIVAEAKHLGLGASFIRNVQIGNVVDFIGPSGRMQLHSPIPDNLVFFATGTGIAPFISMFYALKNEAYPGHVTLYYGIRFNHDVLFPIVLEDFKAGLKNFDHHIYASQEPTSDKYTPGRISQVFRDFHPQPNANYYICGHPEMVASVKTELLAHGITEKQLFYEGFTHAVLKE